MIIQLEFLPFNQVTLFDVYDEIGVYVLWSSRARRRPTYIGEGNLLQRITSHVAKDWAARPLHGMVAIINQGTEKEDKWRAEIAESALLFVAEEIDKFPTQNMSMGKTKNLTKLMSRYYNNPTKIKVRLRGVDPFFAPYKKINGFKDIVISVDGNDDFPVTFPWRKV